MIKEKRDLIFKNTISYREAVTLSKEIEKVSGVIYYHPKRIMVYLQKFQKDKAKFEYFRINTVS